MDDLTKMWVLGFIMVNCAIPVFPVLLIIWILSLFGIEVEPEKSNEAFWPF